MPRGVERDQDIIQEGRKGLGGPPEVPGGVGSHSQRARRHREAHPDGCEGSGGFGGPPGVP